MKNRMKQRYDDDLRQRMKQSYDDDLVDTVRFFVKVVLVTFVIAVVWLVHV